ncbi:MAG: hypothetical protein Q8P52_01860 [bacterium]|nr:hypothetical protein [bacterium]
MTTRNIEKLLKDEDAAYSEVQELRKVFSNFGCLMDNVSVKSKAGALERAVSVLQSFFGKLDWRTRFQSMDAGHGIGHLTRDYVNALMLFSKLETRPKDIFIGFLGGVLHDVGCALVHRFEESHRVVRHAEAAALFLKETLYDVGLNEAETLLVSYSVAAHTHYLRESEVKCSDGVTRKVRPYDDIAHFGPLWPVWYTRWVDRLDCNGPCFIPRHYLTLTDDHKDFAGEDVGFVQFKFADQMRPLLRPKEEQNNPPQTMLEHAKMFAESQSNDSPYGKYDFGRMIELRSEFREILEHIIYKVKNPRQSEGEDRQWHIQRFTNFLSDTVEPSCSGERAAANLEIQFKKLPAVNQDAWFSGFETVITDYTLWFLRCQVVLDQIPPNWLTLPGVTNDLRDFISGSSEPR